MSIRHRHRQTPIRFRSVQPATTRRARTRPARPVSCRLNHLVSNRSPIWEQSSKTSRPLNQPKPFSPRRRTTPISIVKCNRTFQLMNNYSTLPNQTTRTRATVIAMSRHQRRLNDRCRISISRRHRQLNPTSATTIIIIIIIIIIKINTRT